MVAQTSVAHADASNFDELVTASDVPVLLDFSAEWCPPCRVQKPVLESLASDVGGAARVVTVDVDQSPQIASQFGIRNIPTLAVVVGGRVTEQWSGYTPKAELLRRLRSAGANV